MRRALGALVATAAAMSLIGVAWAGSDVTSDAELLADIAASSHGRDAGAVVDASAAARATTDDSTPTTIEDDTTSTTIDDDTTSTTLDDDDADDDGTATTALGVKTYVVADVGTVTIDFVGNAVILVGVDAPGWTIEVDKAEQDRIEIEFRKGEAEAEFEVELHNGSLRVEIESD